MVEAHQETVFSVAKGLKQKFWWGRESQGPNFYPIFEQGPKRGRTFFFF
jgi:hypothetical protein